ncbi:MAG: transposase [Verrucomicrobia bacterium]|nr:transposase [Verrucomicrobiota bacterium]
MEESRQPNRTGPPHNPGVRELIEGKRRWSSPPKRGHARLGFRGWHERGYLPHRDSPGLTQFVTFHVADSFPRALRAEWQALLRVEDNRERRKQLECYLDHGRGACHLREPDVGQMVDEALRFYHGKRYALLAWVVMPNHVHALLTIDEVPLGQIMADLKEYTARQANQRLGRRGQFWAKDYFDTYMRNTEHELKARRYIENNPTRAYLVQNPKEWPWSSVRFRNENGELHL